MGELVDNCYPSQRIAGMLSIILSTVVMALGFWWGAHKAENKDGWLNGFNHCTIHGTLMLLGMCFAYTQAITSFRALHFLGHDITKAIHSFWHAAAMAIMITALYYIIRWHNEQKLGHLSSMHSWLGLITILIYFQNWILGIFHFGLPNIVPLDWKKKYLPSHRFLGIVGILVAAATMETGIAQKNWIDGTNGCLYSFTDTNYQNNPAAGYDQIDAGCRAAFGIGLLLILNTIIAIYALWQFPPTEPSYRNVVTTEGGKQLQMVNP